MDAAEQIILSSGLTDKEIFAQIRALRRKRGLELLEAQVEEQEAQ
jgi:hypothetical protein